MMTHHFDNLHGASPDSIKVLLTAFAGKAAFLINGTTFHTAFALPINQFSGTMPKLSDDIVNTVRARLIDLKVLIIDEISMVGSGILSRVNTRLIQITGVNQPFGGISVLVVGDLRQLPPVMDKYVFQSPEDTDLSVLSGNIQFSTRIFKIFTSKNKKYNKKNLLAETVLMKKNYNNKIIHFKCDIKLILICKIFKT